MRCSPTSSSPGARAGRSGCCRHSGPDATAVSRPSGWSRSTVAPVSRRSPTRRPRSLRAREMLGVPPDHPMTLHSVSHWQFEGVVARRFRVGSAFLAGDAAHRHPPTGGLGPQRRCPGRAQPGLEARGRAQGTGGRLAAGQLRGRTPAGDRLLHGALAGERRPARADRLRPRARAGSVRGGGLAARSSVFVERHARTGEKRRALVAEAVAENANDYSQLNVEAGFFYATGALIPDGTAPPAGADSPVDFHPTTRPGHHLPHVWLSDYVGRDARAAGVDPGPGVDRWLHPVRRPVARRRSGRRRPPEASDGSGYPIAVVVVVRARSRSGRRSARSRTSGAVLVRPDRKVAWRTPTAPADPTEELHWAVTTLLRERVPRARRRIRPSPTWRGSGPPPRGWANDCDEPSTSDRRTRARPAPRARQLRRVRRPGHPGPGRARRRACGRLWRLRGSRRRPRAHGHRGPARGGPARTAHRGGRDRGRGRRRRPRHRQRRPESTSPASAGS